MTYIYKLGQRVLNACNTGTQEDTKRIAELSMALHYVQALSLDDQDHSLATDLQARLFDAMHSDTQLWMCENPFLIQQAVTSYVFLPAAMRTSTYYDGLLATFTSMDLCVQECFPYRAMERNHLLYKLGLGEMDPLDGCAILVDSAHAQHFNRDMAYAFTHSIFYSTDFTLQKAPDPLVKVTAMVLAAQSYDNDDIDLFFECCLCLTGQDLSPAEIEDILKMVSQIMRRKSILFQCNDVRVDYHPLFVFDFLQASLQKRFGRLARMAGNTDDQPAGPISDLRPLLTALKSKNIDNILAEKVTYEVWHGWPEMLNELMETRLKILHKLAATGSLFEREFAVLGQRDVSVYETYTQKIAAAIGG